MKPTIGHCRFCGKKMAIFEMRDHVAECKRNVIAQGKKPFDKYALPPEEWVRLNVKR